MNQPLRITNLTKDYGRGRGAFDVSLELSPGEILGFIGPNGAGKSTTINMISGLIGPDKGQIELFSHQATHNRIQGFKDRIGLLYSEPYFPPGLTPRIIFKRTATLRGLSKDSWKDLSEYLEVDLDRDFGKLSLGNRKKVGVVVALMHQPDLVIVDEPTSGLDPLMQQKFLKLLLDVKERGGAVMLSSHILTEVEAICDSIAMIKGGKIIERKNTQELLNSLPRVFRLHRPSEELLQSLQELDANLEIKRFQDEAKCYTHSHSTILKHLMSQDITDFYLERPSLEEIFLEQYNTQSS